MNEATELWWNPSLQLSIDLLEPGSQEPAADLPDYSVPTDEESPTFILELY